MDFSHWRKWIKFFLYFYRKWRSKAPKVKDVDNQHPDFHGINKATLSHIQSFLKSYQNSLLTFWAPYYEWSEISSLQLIWNGLLSIAPIWKSGIFHFQSAQLVCQIIHVELFTLFKSIFRDLHYPPCLMSCPLALFSYFSVFSMLIFLLFRNFGNIPHHTKAGNFA